MSSDGKRQSRNGGGDLQYEAEQVKDPNGHWWFGIWESGDLETHVRVRSEGAFPLNLGDWQ